jgi:hypothetical protein
VDVDVVRAVDLPTVPGVVGEAVRGGDAWPLVHDKRLNAEILVMASPTWLGQALFRRWGRPLWGRVLERMDAMLSETDDEGRPVAHNRVVAWSSAATRTARTTSSARSPAPSPTSATPPAARPEPTGTSGQALARTTLTTTGAGPGPVYLDDDRGRDWSHRTGRAMAANPYAVARALGERPVGAPPG